VDPTPVVIDVGPPPARGHGSAAVAVGEGSVWVRTGPYGPPSTPFTTLVRIDVATGHRLAVIPVDIDSYGGLAVGEGWVWLNDLGKNRIVRIDTRPASVVESIALTLPANATGCSLFSPSVPLIGEGSVWVKGSCGAIARIDPTTGKVTATLDV